MKIATWAESKSGAKGGEVELHPFEVEDPSVLQWFMWRGVQRLEVIHTDGSKQVYERREEEQAP